MKCSPWQILTCAKPKPILPQDKPRKDVSADRTTRRQEGKQAPEFTPIPIVFNLCSTVDSGGVTRKFVEEYSGYSGFHIRTIPGNRWRNPQFIASGNSVVAVVDRFGDLDMVRITDKYGGAGEAGFDEDGFPLDSVQWDSIADVDSVTLPAEYRATGLCVVERGTVLVNLLGPDGNHYVYRYQIESDDPLLDSLISIGDYGTPLGAPVGLYSRPGEQMYLGASVVQNDAGSAILIFDWLDQTPVAMMALPDAWEPVGVGEANNVLSVLLQQGSTTRILRFPLNIYTSVASGGVRGDELPKPGDVTMTQTFMPVDSGKQEGDLTKYKVLAQIANKDFGRIESYPEPNASETTQLAQGGRRLGSGQTSGGRNDNRTQVFEDYTSSYYGPTVILRGNFLNNPASTTIVGLCGCYGAVCEILRPVDEEEKPVFRLVEGKNYDYLSDGGFVYGCSSDQLESESGVTSGYRTESMSVDVGYERGALKDLPDLKVALVDSDRGLFIFQPLKPYKNEDGKAYLLYSGEYADLDVPTGSTVKSSPCTTTEDATAEAIDGIVRPGHTRPTADPGPDEFTKDTEDLDAPWAFFLRRAILGRNPSLGPSVKSWSTREQDGILFWPEWRDTIGIHTETYSDELFWPPVSPNVAEPIKQSSCRSGFFVPNYPKEQTTTHQYAQDQIAELEAQNASGTLTPEQIAANNAQIADLQQQIATTDDDPLFVIPSSIMNVRYNRLEGSKAQELEPPTEGGALDQSDQVEIPPALSTDPPIIPWQTVEIPGLDRAGEQDDNLRRGASMQPNIRSWIGVDTLLDRLGVVTDGVAGYRNAAYWSNGLGSNVGGNAFGGSGDIFNPTCHDAAFAYEAGYTAGDGANGVWEVDILFNGRPADKVATRVTFPEQITQQAPLQAQSVLMATLQAAGGVSLKGERKGRVYYTDQVIDTVTIRARLLNYAFGVYRVGYRTVHRNDSGPYVTDSFCPGADPGYFTGAACGDCCGNVSCTSFIFFGNKLFSSDPILPRTRQILWEGECTFRVAEDPYATNLNLGLGRVLDCYMEFKLNSTMSSYSVDISKNQ